MANVTIASSTGAWPFGLSPHPSATFSNDAHLATWYNGTDLVTSLSTDGGITWSAANAVTPMNVGSGQAHLDFCQHGDTLYGAWLDYSGSAWRFIPITLAYTAATGILSATVGAAISVSNINVGIVNPAAGGTELSVSYDTDHTLIHVGVRTTAGLCLYALTPSTLALAFSLTTGGPTSTNHNQPIVYVASGGSTGTLWEGSDGNGGGYPLTVASLSVTASAYGTWSSVTSVINTGQTPTGIGAFLDTTQSPAQPGFVWSDTGGTSVATYNGSSWTTHTVMSGTQHYGGAVQCVGADLWVTYIHYGLQCLKRLNGVWQSGATTLDSGGDRSGWTNLNQSTGSLLVVYTSSSGNGIFAARFLLLSASAGGSGGLTGSLGSTGVTPHMGGSGGLTATMTVTTTAPASLQYIKQQLVLVYNAAGVFIDVWRDAPLLAGVKFAINSATSPIQVTLPRAFDNYDEAGTVGIQGGSARGSIAQGNVVQYWLFGPGLPSNGLLKFQGFIDAYAPEIAESGEERLTVTLTPFDAVVGDSGLLGSQTFGTPATPASYVDPISMFNWWFSNNDPLTALPYAHPLTLSASNPATSGVTTQYTFTNQKLGSIWETIRAMLPANWFWRINADKSVTLNVAPTTAQHQFVIGQHIVAPQYRKDWTRLKNVAQVVGTGLTTALTTALTNGTAYTSLSVAVLPAGVIAGQTLVLNSGGNPSQTVTVASAASSGATSVSVTSFIANGNYPAQTQVMLQIAATAQGSDLATYGKRATQLADNRIVDQNTAAALARGLITAYDQMLLRTRIRVVDYRGDHLTTIGYDIETIEPGDTCVITLPSDYTPLPTLWDNALWDNAYWDSAPGGILQAPAIITALSYNFDYVDLEISALAPNQDVDLLTIRSAFQDFTLAQ